MSKDFEGWHQHKAGVDKNTKRYPFKQREVWWCSLGVNVGDEQDGKGTEYNRPVLVLRKFNKHVFYGIPLTTQLKKNPYYLEVHFQDRKQCVVLSQVRLWDAKRLTNRMGMFSPTQYEKVMKSVSKMFTAP